MMEMEDAARRELLQALSEAQLEDVARWCNRYPDIAVSHQVRGAVGQAPSPAQCSVGMRRVWGGEAKGVQTADCA